MLIKNENLNFGQAIELLKQGKPVSRRGWNGKHMFLRLKPAVTIRREWCKDPLLIKVIDCYGGRRHQYFIMYAGRLIREVWTDCVCPRLETPSKTDKIARAVCYEVMGRACRVIAYACLPEPIRKDVDNEMGKNQRARAERDIREHIAGRFLAKAAVDRDAVDLEIKHAAIDAGKATQRSNPILGKNDIREHRADASKCGISSLDTFNRVFSSWIVILKLQVGIFKIIGRKFKIQGRKFKIQSQKFKIHGKNFKVYGKKFKVYGKNFKVYGRNFYFVIRET